MVRRLGRFSSRVRHWGVPDRDRVPDRCSSSGSAVDVCSDATAGARRAEHAADGGVVYVSRTLYGSPRAPRVNDLRQSRRLEKGGTAQSGSFVSRLQAAPLTISPFGPIVDLPPLVCGCTPGSSPHPYRLSRHSTPEPRNGALYSSCVVP